MTGIAPLNRAQHVGYLAQSALTSFPFTVEEYVSLGLAPHDEKTFNHRDVMDAVIESLTLECFEIARFSAFLVASFSEFG